MTKLPANTQSYLEAFYQGPKIQSFDPIELKAIMAQAPAPEVAVELPAIQKVEDRMIPTSDGQEIRVRVYTPEGNGPFPILVYYHGGGWVIGAVEMFEAANRMTATNANAVVVSVDYRLAPENPFPTPLQDAVDALNWVYENAKAINGDANRILVGGDSAGGNLATVVSKHFLDHNGPKISAQLLIYPVTNLDFTTKSYEQYADGYGLDRDLMVWFGKYYTLDEKEFSNPLVSPLQNESLKGLPPAIIVAAEHDVLKDEGAQYAEKLKADGVEVEYQVIPGTVHGFYSNVDFFKEETEQVVNAITTFAQKLIQRV